MKLSDTHIAKLKKLYEDHFGIELSDKEAQKMGMKLALYVKQLL